MSYQGLDGAFSAKFYDQDTRKGFVKKVYGILGLQLLLTFALTLWPVYHMETRVWMHQHQGMTIAAAVSLIVISCTMICCIHLTRMVPVNYFLLFAFTLCEAYLMADLAARTYPAYVVTQAMFMTGIIVVSLSLFAWLTPMDFVIMGPILILCIGLSLMMSLIFFFVFSAKAMNAFYCGIGVLIYSIYLVIDTQLIMGGKRYELEIDDYILAAFILYTDIIMIFLYILRLLSNNR